MTKLTLSVDELVVARAKSYAASQGTSVSRLVERYLDLVSRAPTDDDSTPILSRLRGVIEGAGADTQQYPRYLEGKYR